MKKLKRFNIQKILADPDLRRRMVVRSTIATQAREGIDVTEKEAEDSYYVVTEGERAAFFELVPFRSEAGENDGRHVEFIRSINKQSEKTRLDISLSEFSSIESYPLAYDKIALVGHIFEECSALEPTYGIARQGKSTADLTRWTRKFWEITNRESWKTYVKSDYFSRFYTDFTLVINWSEDNRSHLKLDGNGLPNQQYYFLPGITWTFRSGKGFCPKILPVDCVFSQNGMAIIPTASDAIPWMLGVLASRISEFLLGVLTSGNAYDAGIIKRFPLPSGLIEGKELLSGLTQRICNSKYLWDTGNEICTRFDRPWVLQTTISDGAATLSVALDAVLDHEASLDVELESTYAQLNDAVYRLYGVNDRLREKLEAAIGKRPPEIVWPQMENKDRDQKRREHVDRLLCYLVKRIVEADEDGLVCFESVAHEPPLLARLRKELSACFLQQDPSTLETEVVNELKKKTKGYRRAETLTEWLQDAFFDTHTSLYQQRPLIWHLASNQVCRVPAIGVLVHAHKFNADALAKLRGTHLRDRLATLRREAGQASQDGREDDRIETLAAIEELEAYDAKLKHLQDGHYTGPEGGDRDYRILTPWKSETERPQGWNPDLDDGIKVNIAPLARTNLLRRKMRFAEAEKED
jgi:hypothetical protein